MAPLPSATSATVEAIYAAYEARTEERRRHLGASEIGHECDRWLWYSFRWAVQQKFDGRMLRLFDTGHLAEPRFIADLRAIGCEVSDGPEPGRQWRAVAVDGHFGSAIDAAVLCLPEAPKTWHLAEFKTHSAKSFASVKAKGVRASKTQHYAQMIVGMDMHGFTRAFYLAVNKDTDELYAERVHADPIEAARLLERARRIIEADSPPERISNDPCWWQCRFCPAHAICHEGKFPDRNCKTCLHSTPVADGKWSCALHGDCEPDLAGCPDHLYLPSLVPGEQVDAGDTWVSYRLRDGSEWFDGTIARAPCVKCGGTEFIPEPGKGPHRAHLRCKKCGRGGQWLPKIVAAAGAHILVNGIACAICGGFGSSLPTHCPGSLMSIAQKEAVSNGRDNFSDGVWLGAPF